MRETPQRAARRWRAVSALEARSTNRQGAVIALSPNIVAHAALAATDICFVAAALAALLALASYVERRSPQRLALLTAALGAALAAKYTAVTLFPAVAVVLALTDRDRRAARCGWRAGPDERPVRRLAGHRLGAARLRDGAHEPGAARCAPVAGVDGRPDCAGATSAGRPSRVSARTHVGVGVVVLHAGRARPEEHAGGAAALGFGLVALTNGWRTRPPTVSSGASRLSRSPCSRWSTGSISASDTC